MEQVLASHEKEIKEKEKLIQIIQKDQAQIREQASEQAKAAARNEILQREEQIRRFKDKVEMLEKQLTLTQSELKGEVGEKDLLNSLIEAFREEGDVFTRQTRGISEGDIVHQVRTPSGSLLETTFVYDNKEVASITKKDVEKGKYYKEHHKTDYFFIVSSQIPKCIKNKHIGKKDGIWVVHRDVIIDVAKVIRGAVIEIGRLSASKLSQETKESKLYDYLTGRVYQKNRVPL